MEKLQNLANEYLAFIVESDPIDATRLGIHSYDEQLGDLTPDAIAERADKRQKFLARFTAIDPETLSADEQMDLQVAKIDLQTALRRHEDLCIWKRAPYWYLERLGGSFSDLINRDFAPQEDRGRRLLSRLQKAPAYLQAAITNLTDEAPPLYVEMGLTAAMGLDLFLHEAVIGFSANLPSALETDLNRAVSSTLAALSNFVQFLQELCSRARGHYACGPDHFNFLLQTFHQLDMDHRSLYEFGLEQMAADRDRLEAYARQQDPNCSWREQIERIKENHPPPVRFKESYEREMKLARDYCVSQDLVTLPEGECCWVEWLPTYLRATLPIAVMSTSPPFESGLVSRWLITPLDPEAPPNGRNSTCGIIAMPLRVLLLCMKPTQVIICKRYTTSWQHRIHLYDATSAAPSLSRVGAFIPKT